MNPTKFLWILSLSVIFLIGRVTATDGSVAAFSVTGVVADLDAVNTTTLHLIWDSQLKPDNITIDRYVIEVNNVHREEIPSDNETSSYNYTITGLTPGVSYNVTLIVVYTQEVEATTVDQETTQEIETTTVAQATTTVTVLDTTTTSALTTQSSVLSTSSVAQLLRESITLRDPIYLFNNTYPETPTGVIRTGGDTKSLTFTWNQVGQADACYMWTDDATMTTSNCYSHSNGSATGTISGLPVAGKAYTVQIAAVSGGLYSAEASTDPERTLPPNPSAPQCLSQTTTSFTFMIPPPYDQSPDSFEFDEYAVIVQSLIVFLPFNTTKLENVTNKSSENIEMTIDDVGIAAGVTYGITLTSRVAGVSSAGSNSSNCVTEPNVPLINGVVETTEVMVNATWQTPSGYFDGFNVSCVGQDSTKNTFAINFQNQTSSGTPQTLSAECHNVTAGALYEVNVVSILLNQSLTSKASDSVSNVTVPYAPTKVEPTNATTTTLIQLSVAYEYDESVSQCTHFEVSNLTETVTVEKADTIPASNPTVEFGDLTADRWYNFSTYAISDYTQHDSNFWRRSSNSTSTIAWTLSPSVSNITGLERRPWSLHVQFDQTDPHEHVFKYTIHVDAESGRIKTLDLICNGATDEALTTLNCDPTNPDVPTYPIDCKTMSSCEATTVFPESTQGVAEVTTVAGVKTTTTTVPEDVTTSTMVARLLEDSPSQSICFNISDLQPYINYSISVQAVNPGGCSVKESVALITAESIPGCVDITSSNASFNSIEVYWNPPDKPNGIITQYVISYTRQDGKPTLGTNPIRTKETSCTIEPLEPYVAYNITVAAETSVGVGASSGCPLSNTLVSTSITQPYRPNLELDAIDSTSINISWTLARDVQTGPETYYNLTIADTVDVTWILKQHVEGFYTRSIVVGGLDEWWGYNVAIVAYTIDEFGLELSTVGTIDYIRTLESTPGPVQLLTVTSLSSQHMCYLARVEWEPPAEREKNGNITGYTLTWNETGQTYSANTKSADVEVEPNEKSYTFTIVATTKIGNGTNVTEVLDSTGICRPAPLNVEAVLGGPLNITQTSFTVLYDPLAFTDNANGPVIASAILVAEEGTGSNLTNTEVYDGQELFNGARKWKDAIDVNPIPEYRPTPDSWLTDSSGLASHRQRRELSATYIVGKDGSCSKESDVYCNGPIQPGRIYRIRALICTQQDMCYKTRFVSYKVITVETSDESMAWIAGVVIGILALIILIILLLYFLYFKKKRQSPYEAKDDNGREIGLRNFPAPPPDVAKPVRVIDFSAHVVQMHRNSDLEFNDEYQSIQNQSARRPWTAAEKPKNRVKNRFVNILPFDHSRVTLRGSDNDPYDSESDYINANYIPTIRGIREFIACQGPLESTKDDFWQMVWEHQCRVIVMLTNLKERGREKCAQYWPETQNEPSRFRNDICVDLITESTTDQYVIRKFKVWTGTQTREIFQFHFVSWPDFGVPDDPEKVLSFIRMVRKYAGNNVDPPMVVHCSAGVGRTGTFIVLDRLLRELPRAETIDIFSMVLQLRENRCLMVQTEAQYVFIHDCMKLEIERTLGYNNHTYDDFDESSFNDEEIYQNAGELHVDNNLQTFAHD